MASSLQQFPKTGEAPPEAQNNESRAFAQFFSVTFEIFWLCTYCRAEHGDGAVKDA